MTEHEKLIADIEGQVARSEKYDEGKLAASWGYETGVLLSRAEAKTCLAALRAARPPTPEPSDDLVREIKQAAVKLFREGDGPAFEARISHLLWRAARPSGQPSELESVADLLHAEALKYEQLAEDEIKGPNRADEVRRLERIAREQWAAHSGVLDYVGRRGRPSGERQPIHDHSIGRTCQHPECRAGGGLDD